MTNELIFSYAENAEGKMVNVDDVPRGLQCGCFCPHCHEQLMARHGDIREHGFAHHSKERGANLKICYMVILYKLAEQIILTKKKIQVPSYYGIFKAECIEFEDIKIDGGYEREDKQPDVIATTKDGKQYLIEFKFNYKVQHKKALDYRNLTCLEIDLSNQTLESVEKFLLEENTDRKWLNNEIYFNNILPTYERNNKKVRIVEGEECLKCELHNHCCGARIKNDQDPVNIENNGKKYRICKCEQYEQELENLKRRKIQEEQKRIEDIKRRQEEEARFEKERMERLAKLKQQAELKKQNKQSEYNIPQFQIKAVQHGSKPKMSTEECNPDAISCFNCEINLPWDNRNGYAHCGVWERLNVPKRTNPSTAQTCKMFKKKSK